MRDANKGGIRDVDGTHGAKHSAHMRDANKGGSDKGWGTGASDVRHERGNRNHPD